MTRTRTLRMIAVPAAGALVAGFAVTTLAAPAQAAPAPCSYLTNSGLAPGEADFDGDGVGDVAYGVPARNPGGVGGSVIVTQSAKGTKKLTRTSIGGGASTSGDAFGTVVRTAEINGDHCTDLFVSAPGAYGSSGRVYVVFGAANGLGTGASTFTIAAPKVAKGDRFGAAFDVAAAYRGSNWSATLAVGAPGTDVTGLNDAGMVHRFYVEGYDTMQATRVWSWSQGAKGVGTAEAGDRFGEVVTVVAANSPDVVVGVPRENLGKTADAGEVDIRTSGDTVRVLSQKTKGVAGAPAKNDRFGASVVQSGLTLAIGAPGEKVGKATSAGQVHVFTQREDKYGNNIGGSYKVRRALTLDTAHVTGAPRKSDQLGASLTILRGLQHTNGLTVAAGLPNRKVGSLTGAGSVALFELTPKHCAKKAPVCGRVLSQSSKGVAGGAAKNAHFGANLGVFGEFGPTEINERRDTLVVGTPGGTYGKVKNAGLYVQWRPTTSKLVSNPAGVRAGGAFGMTEAARWSAPSLYR